MAKSFIKVFGSCILVFYVIYIGKYLDKLSDTSGLLRGNARTVLIQSTVSEFANKGGIFSPFLRLSPKPNYPYSVAPFLTPGVIVLPSNIYDSKAYSTEDVKAIIGHELGHIKHRDTYCKTFIPKVQGRINKLFGVCQSNVEMEESADLEGRDLAGCQAMTNLYISQREFIDDGADDNDDPHPTFERRLQIVACPKQGG